MSCGRNLVKDFYPVSLSARCPEPSYAHLSQYLVQTYCIGLDSGESREGTGGGGAMGDVVAGGAVTLTVVDGGYRVAQ